MAVQARKESLLLGHDERIRFVVRRCPQFVRLNGLEHDELIQVIEPRSTLPDQ
jgi:hypothetical protein